MNLVNAKYVPNHYDLFWNSQRTRAVGTCMIHFCTKTGSNYEYDPDNKRIRRTEGDPRHSDRLQNGDWHSVANIVFDTDFGATIQYSDGKVAYTSKIVSLSAARA